MIIRLVASEGVEPSHYPDHLGRRDSCPLFVRQCHIRGTVPSIRISTKIRENADRGVHRRKCCAAVDPELSFGYDARGSAARSASVGFSMRTSGPVTSRYDDGPRAVNTAHSPMRGSMPISTSLLSGDLAAPRSLVPTAIWLAFLKQFALRLRTPTQLPSTTKNSETRVT